MNQMITPPMFDGHNDVLLKLFNAGTEAARQGFKDGDDGHIDLPKAACGGFGGGFFAIYVPSPHEADDFVKLMNSASYDLPMPAPITQVDALGIVISQAAILSRLEQDGALKICTRAADIRDCLDRGKMAAVMHMEGAEAIDPDFEVLDVLHRAGLRSIGPV